MGWFNHEKANEAYNTNPDDVNESSWTHEIVGAAAGFEAMRKYNQYKEENGQPESHALAKEIFAGFVAAEVDKLVETKGADFIDREAAKRHAQKEAEQAGALTPDNY